MDTFLSKRWKVYLQGRGHLGPKRVSVHTGFRLRSGVARLDSDMAAAEGG